MRQSRPHVLREYALLADGERGIVVGPEGDFAWMPAPRWHDDAVFSSLLGGPGIYSLTPTGDAYVWGGHYEDGSLIWRSRWVTTEAVVECREALAFPGDPDRAVALRRVEVHRGRARVRAQLEPRAGFGAAPLEDLSRRGGVWTGRTGPLTLRWTGADRAERHASALSLELELAEGEHHDLVLELSTRALPEAPVAPAPAWASTEEAWRRGAPDLSSNLAPRDARHAWAVLRGLTSRDGGMVAAATTSLPERAQTGRNYDYRYAWIRDQCFAGQAAAAAGDWQLLDDAVGFVSARLLEDGPRLRPAYTVDGRDVPEETTLDLPGYPGGAEVRRGNRVRHQFQLDAFGEALTMLATAAELDRLDSDHWRAVEVAVAAVERRWRDADAGIWELDDQTWTHSRLICAAGLRAVADHHVTRSRAATWRRLADTIVDRTSRTSLHPTGRWQRSPTDERVDGALLLPALRGAVPPQDPRSRATLAAVLDELGSEHYVYRFRHDDRPLHEAEGAFLMCGFLVALALDQAGRPDEAMRWFERNRSGCGPPGLFTEEFDVVQRQLRGNLPQAFVHAVLLESAQRLGGSG